MSDQPIKRVTTVRRITYQGPADWVDSCLGRMIVGVLNCGDGKQVVGEVSEISERPVQPIRHVNEVVPHAGTLENFEGILDKERADREEADAWGSLRNAAKQIDRIDPEDRSKCDCPVCNS